jgi:hypothetical protein
MKLLFLVLMLNTSLFAANNYIAEYPIGPDYTLTPGSLCNTPDSYRYPEQIPYCSRDSLEVGIKEEVFREYRQKGYRLDLRNREDYKIDHLIPLCAGGSNQETNLWPQHRTIYEITDPIESLGCEKLKQGRIKQADLVYRMLAAKRNLNLVPQTIQYLKSLR